MARRTKAQREKDLERIAELYLHGWRQSDIAVDLDVTQQTISNDLQELYRRWQNRATTSIDAAKARELARIDELERTYWAEWVASKEERQSTTTKRIQRPAEDKKDQLAQKPMTLRDEATIHKEGRLGDPRYLAGVQWCIERRCTILGINAPIKGELTGADGGPIQHEHLGTISLVEVVRTPDDSNQ
ncbi:MAG: hypothetical protein WC455_24500 [Dehalococcoidia bacterium]|jgi:hypothetical protein